MDIRSIVRAFRFGEMQRKHERDPNARRPPSIMFLAALVALLAIAVVGAQYFSRGDSGADAGVYEAPTPTDSPTDGNRTSSGSPAFVLAPAQVLGRVAHVS